MTFSFSTGYGSWGPSPPPPGAPEIEMVKYKLDIAERRVKELTQGQKMLGVVLALEEDKAIVLCGGAATVECARPSGMKIGPGTAVRLNVDNGTPKSIASVVDWALSGAIVKVVEMISETVAVVSAGPQGDRTVCTSAACREGDRVVLDATNNVIVKNLGRGTKAHAFTGDTGVTWDDVVGLTEAKRALREAIEEPFTKKDTYKKFGIRRARGVLLHGAPGCGKTMLGRAAASALAELHGKKGVGGLIHLKGPEVLSMFVGQSEAKIRSIFSAARDHHEATGTPAVIFLDEADAILGRRGTRRSLDGMETTVVPQFLSEMDGLTDSGAFIIIATNRADGLDPAIVRDGRIDRKILITRPTEEDAAGIVEKLLEKRPRSQPAKKLAEATASRLFDERRTAVINVSVAAQADAKIVTPPASAQAFCLKHIVSGALVAGLVDRATQRAIRRAIAGDETTAIARDDLFEAIEEVRVENLHIDQSEPLSAFVEGLQKSGLNVTKIEKAS